MKQMKWCFFLSQKTPKNTFHEKWIVKRPSFVEYDESLDEHIIETYFHNWVTIFFYKLYFILTKRRIHQKCPFILNCYFSRFLADKWSIIIWACWWIKLVTIEKRMIKVCWCHWKSPKGHDICNAYTQNKTHSSLCGREKKSKNSQISCTKIKILKNPKDLINGTK